ncbi:uncharacterized protein B0I36DRAFT_369281 [Microdochium trichocladiopsis]|uniref:Zn(2)-C6 fungal-type domain-containing protein n=1 Tax=Microdochium trichocladiopsis TaxID=1682393 RepID=A0A9P9BJ61_9PEZI|nr:uncharacterized protein B0I36DRAFT_369281 [Microdochium trichocladiopsis]KAH7014311.1 hypothetical protein B0I36DRAFT_369281 [Microdochium trichocladiopsis]
MTAARACESCHKDKGKCIFPDNSAACSRCLRLDRQCRPRVARRMGRPPVARTMSHGNYLVMDLDSPSPAPAAPPPPAPTLAAAAAPAATASTSSPGGPTSAAGGPAGAALLLHQSQQMQAAHQGRPYGSPSVTSGHSQQGQQLLDVRTPDSQSGLDRHTPYSGVGGSDSASVTSTSPDSHRQYQNHHHQHPSQTQQQQQHSKRVFHEMPPQVSAYYQSHPAHHPQQLPPINQAIPQFASTVDGRPTPPLDLTIALDSPLGDMGRRVQELLENRDGFFHVHRHFMFGRNFADEYQAAVKRLFKHSPHTLAAAYDAVLSQLDLSSMQVREDGRAGQDLKAGSDCIKALIEASSSVNKPEDAALVMMLAQILFVYNMAIGWPAAHMVVRSSLLAIKDWYPVLTRTATFDPIVITPVLLDTIDCLVKREIPVVRLDCTDRVPIDRLLGLCATLLPLMYDLCELSHRAASAKKERGPHAQQPLASSPQDFEARYRATYYNDEYTDIEQKITAWSPTWPAHFLTAYSPVEVVAMLAQARLYRTASLLIIHRLRFPLGVEDRVARCHADAILNEFCNIEAWTSNPDHGLRFATDFPLLVATLELPERGGAIVERLKPLRIQPLNSKGIVEFADVARRAMREGYMGLWFDLAEKRLNVDVLP